MPNYEEMQKNRMIILDKLDECISLAYSGIPSIEYDALKVAKSFIKTKLDSDTLIHDLTDFGREDK